MLKEYASRWNSLGLRTTINGASKLIQFNPKRDGGSYYVTTNKDEMVALESNKRFKIDYTLFSVKEAKDDTPDPAIVIPLEVINDPITAAKKGELIEIQVIEEVVNVMQAREYLKKKGIDYRKLNTPNAVLKQAQEINVEFPNLKIG